MSTFPQLTQEIKDAIHSLRDSPKTFAKVIKKNLQNFKENNLYHRHGFVPLKTSEGIEGAKKLRKKLRKLQSLPTLTDSPGLTNAALHIASLLSEEQSLEEISPTKVISEYGCWFGSVVLLIDEGNVTGKEVLQSLLIDDGLELKTNQEALLNPYFRFLGIGAVPKKSSVTLNVILLASDFADNANMKEVTKSEVKLEKNLELDDWVENATKLDCEITQESSSDRVITRVKQIWHLVDESTLVTEKILE